MRNFYKYAVLSLLTVLLFIPFYPVTVVPTWELQFVNKDNTPASSVIIDQIWKHHSLEWGWRENSDLGLQTDSNGYIKLPARRISVSIFKLIGSQIRDAIMRINPHASFGSDSYVVCRKSISCVVSYKSEDENPQRVVLW